MGHGGDRPALPGGVNADDDQTLEAAAEAANAQHPEMA